ncbi:ABC transporter permease [Extibacter muris]|uniref:ABC transporter permease n=1 Tax=Extibacter muris TaxID=1796622 RepID=UPI001D098257|nr:ABC transporter permease [Extibacter muris]MCB6200456.1 ABC transporter permease [Extibacter muris]MCQ4663433.1 ABC transporter permease [Extibacter muris]MCQ4692857.1 ABC transporter permease [Extibacter muris]
MKGLRYQLKSVLRDKFCLMTFLLPIVVAAALNFVGTIDFTTLGELHFGVLQGGLPTQTVSWLERYGPVTVYQTMEELTEAVIEPSTNLIGVKADGSGIKTMLSGDELDIFRQTADTLPDLYEQRQAAGQTEVHIFERPDVMAGFQDMFIAVTLIVAMFMGCTFNAMNMISEKEDGVACINEILPMSHSRYILQKLSVGFICGCLSSVITVCICFRLTLKNAALMLVLIVLSAFVAALIGLFIGRTSSGLMVGVVYIKIVMIFFMAVPILRFLVGIRQPLLSAVCYLVPSQATFEGIMDVSTGSGAVVVKDIFILLAHCIGWFLLYIGLSVHQRKNA